MDELHRIDAFKLLETPAADLVAAGTGRLEAKARTRYSVAQALVQGRIDFHYQPIVAARNLRVPAFFEVLARLRSPQGEMVPAGRFMPAIEEGPLGRAVDRLALLHAIEALKADPALRLSVNMSPLSMGDEEWLDTLTTAARKDRSVCGRLILEITEAAALKDADQTLDFMNYVRRTGCAFALDDFGAGATSFRYFRDFRFDIVKIDGSFVDGVDKVRDLQVLVECLTAVARHFEMMTVAERVETQAEADCLRGIGVDCLQGWLVGRPGPKAVLPEPKAEPKNGGHRIAG